VLVKVVAAVIAVEVVDVAASSTSSLSFSLIQLSIEFFHMFQRSILYFCMPPDEQNYFRKIKLVQRFLGKYNNVKILVLMFVVTEPLYFYYMAHAISDVCA
jgi:hypothetical protein